MKISSVFFFMTVISLFTTKSIFAQNINFSGTWKRVTEKSDAGGLSLNSIPVKIDVVQTGNAINITRSAKNKLDSTTTYMEKVIFDGSKALSHPRPEWTKSSTIIWSEDKQNFTDSAEYENEGGKIIQKTSEKWSLTDNGKTLTIVLVLDTPDSQYHLLEVFEKQ